MPPAAPTTAQVQGVLASLDPSPRTMEQLAKETASLKELMLTKLEGVASRFESMQIAVELLQAAANRSPTVNEVNVQHEEKFRSFFNELVSLKELTKQQFDLVEKQRVEQKKDTKDAVDAALTAQKEAVKEQTTASERAIAKSEAFTTKQIDAIGIQNNARDKGVDDKFDDLKTRVTAVESRSSVSDPSMAFALDTMSKELKALQAASREAPREAPRLGSDPLTYILIGLISLVGVGVIALALVFALTKH